LPASNDPIPTSRDADDTGCKVKEQQAAGADNQPRRQRGASNAKAREQEKIRNREGGGLPLGSSPV